MRYCERSDWLWQMLSFVTMTNRFQVTMRISEQARRWWAWQAVYSRSGEVNLTPNKRGSFGGYGIELDSALATVLGGREGQKISPSEMTKRLWNYIKRNNLGKRN